MAPPLDLLPRCELLWLLGHGIVRNPIQTIDVDVVDVVVVVDDDSMIRCETRHQEQKHKITSTPT
jgi:hypothetical protein